MNNDQEKEKKQQDAQHKDAAVKPEPETLHKTDPQDNMEGPISSLMQKGKDGMNESESKESADAEKDSKM